MENIFYQESSFGVFFLVTGLLGGWSSWMTGRACALTWRSVLSAVLYTVPLAAFIRFIHFIPPFDGTLLSLHYYCVDLVFLMIMSFLGFRFTRAKQMVRQYSWLYEKTSPFTWREKRNR